MGLRNLSKLVPACQLLRPQPGCVIADAPGTQERRGLYLSSMVAEAWLQTSQNMAEAHMLVEQRPVQKARHPFPHCILTLPALYLTGTRMPALLPQRARFLKSPCLSFQHKNSVPIPSQAARAQFPRTYSRQRILTERLPLAGKSCDSMVEC